MSMNVSLGQLEIIVKQKVESGLYSSASEVLREALRLLIQKEREEQELAYLRQAVEDGINSGESKPFDMDKIIKGGKKILAKKYGKKVD